MVPFMQLNDGRSIPQLGFGLWQASDPDAEKSTLEAFRTGYRSIDGAAIYRNENGLGRAVKASGLKREDLFITTKLWNEDQGREATLKAIDASLKRLDLEYVDLYLIHWPAPKKGLFVETWKTLIDIRNQGLAKSIGVSNFTEAHLEKIIGETGVVPVLNQIELHPQFQQMALRRFHQTHNIRTESWSPLGQGKLLQNPTLKAIGEKYRKSPAQVIIRWHLQNDLILIPKSVTPSRIHENFQIFDFTLNADDLGQIAKLDSASGRIGPDPMTADF